MGFGWLQELSLLRGVSLYICCQVRSDEKRLGIRGIFEMSDNVSVRFESPTFFTASLGIVENDVLLIGDSQNTRAIFGFSRGHNTTSSAL